jgi:hypothetical protein
VNPHKPFHNQKLPDSSAEDFGALERDLRQALRPVDAPSGFAERVLARSRESSRARVYAFPARRVWIGGAIAAMLLAGVAGRQVQQHRKANEAQRQFELALQVTDRTLQHARLQLQRAGVSLEQ